MLKHRSTQEWSRIVVDYRIRTGSVARFCAKHRISTAALYYHLKKSRAAAPQPSTSPQKLPRIIELLPQLPPNSPNQSCVDAGPGAAVQISWESAALGTVTLRCHRQDLAGVITQLAGINPVPLRP
jgi:hypothetical protein